MKNVYFSIRVGAFKRSAGRSRVAPPPARKRHCGRAARHHVRVASTGHLRGARAHS